MILLYFKFLAALSQFTVYTPDDLLNTTIPYKVSPIGSPGFYPDLGQIFEISAENCSFASNLLKNSIPIVNKPENCSYTELSVLAQEQKAPFIIFLTANDEYIQDSASNTLVSIPVLSITEEFYLSNLSSYSTILISYENRMVYRPDPSIEIRFIGGFSNRLLYISSVFELVDSLNYSFFDFSVSFSYSPFDELTHDVQKDCINYTDQLYCDKSQETGVELLNSSIISLNIFDSIEKSSHSILQYLTYLQELYSNCVSSPITPCHLELIQKFQYTYNDSINTLENLKNFPSNFSHLLINTQLFPWPSHLVQAYCISSGSDSTNCSLCSPLCNISSYFTESCLDDCNKSACGYSNLQCLSYNGDSLCLNSMINDGICSLHCFLEDDCKGNSKKIGSSSSFEIFLIIICIIIPMFILMIM